MSRFVDQLLLWCGFWMNASMSILNLSFYGLTHHWYSLPCAAFSGFVAIACFPRKEDAK